MNYTNWQYILVFVILIAVILWVIYKLCKKKDSDGTCCGCSLANTCKSEKKQRANEKKGSDNCADKK